MLSRDVSRVNTGVHIRGRAAQRDLSLSFPPVLICYLPLSLISSATDSIVDQQEVDSRVLVGYYVAATHINRNFLSLFAVPAVVSRWKLLISNWPRGCSLAGRIFYTLRKTCRLSSNWDKISQSCVCESVYELIRAPHKRIYGKKAPVSLVDIKCICERPNKRWASWILCEMRNRQYWQMLKSSIIIRLWI